jgi:DNA repair photolyase
VIPFVTEPDLERILTAAAEAGAINAGYVMLRLPWEISPLFRQWLEVHFPDRAARVMNRLRDMRGGKDYDSSFGKRMRGEGIWADLIRQRFEKTVERLGLSAHSRRFKGLDSSRFRPPSVSPAVVQSPATENFTAKHRETKKEKGKPNDQLELF